MDDALRWTLSFQMEDNSLSCKSGSQLRPLRAIAFSRSDGASEFTAGQLIEFTASTYHHVLAFARRLIVEK